MLYLDRTTTVLIVSPSEEDHALLCGMLGDACWRVLRARTPQQAWRTLHEDRVDVVITECDFPNGMSWRDLLEEVENMRASQPVVLASSRPDGQLWAEAINLGAFDVLPKPFDRVEVLRVLDMAARAARTTAMGAGRATFR
jgi:two-component system nitrogen regulation response regulator GlnG